jgi:hypothetical protein
MADVKISALTGGSTPSGAEVGPFVQSGGDVGLTVKQVADSALSSTIYAKASVNFNAANTDTTFPVVLPAGFTTFMVSAVIIAAPSVAINTCTFGLFTASGGGGVAIVAGGTTVTVSSASANTNNNSQATTPGTAATQTYNVAALFFRVGTAKGSAATATVLIHIRPLA